MSRKSIVYLILCLSFIGITFLCSSTVARVLSIVCATFWALCLIENRRKMRWQKNLSAWQNTRNFTVNLPGRFGRKHRRAASKPPARSAGIGWSTRMSPTRTIVWSRGSTKAGGRNRRASFVYFSQVKKIADIVSIPKSSVRWGSPVQIRSIAPLMIQARSDASGFFVAYFQDLGINKNGKKCENCRT